MLPAISSRAPIRTWMLFFFRHFILKICGQCLHENQKGVAVNDGFKYLIQLSCHYF